MQSRVALADAPCPCRWVARPAPSSSSIQREARQPSARGRLSLNKTPMTRATLVFFHPFGFRITGRLPYHQLLNVKQNPPFHQNRPGVVPCRKSKKKKNFPPTSPKTGGGTPPSVKIEENSFKKIQKKKKRKKKKKISHELLLLSKPTPQNPVGAPPLPGKNKESEVTFVPGRVGLP